MDSYLNIKKIALIGFGEVGQIFAQGLLPFVDQVKVWDVKFSGVDLVLEEQEKIKNFKLYASNTLANACSGADLIISAVTASNTLQVAQAISLCVEPGCYFLDLNSASPSTKQAASTLINDQGGIYVEAGVMTSVPPYGIAVPILLGGSRAHTLAEVLLSWGMDVRVVSEDVGRASAIKMCRSVMIKGLEALVIESYVTARHYGVEDFMIPTLQETFPGIDWEKQGSYFFSRVVQHGKRRAEEMREAAVTVKDAGFTPSMSSATADKHDWIAKKAREGIFKDLTKLSSWQSYADCLLDMNDNYLYKK